MTEGKRKGLNTGTASLAAFLLAVAAGLLCPQLVGRISFIGEIYVNLLKALIVPVLFTGIASALAAERPGYQGMTLKTVLLFVVMFIASFLICSLLWMLLKPGAGVFFTPAQWKGEPAQLSFAAFFTSLFPSNIVAAMAENKILPVIIFAAAFGFCVRKCGLERVSLLCGDLNKAFGKMLSYIMYLTPLGVFALLSDTVSRYGGKIVGTAALYIGCAYLGCGVVALLVMMLPVRILCGVWFGEYLRKAGKVWIMTMTTCSSAATLPETIRVCNEEFHVPEEITQLVVPLGCTIHMCGGAVSFSLLAMFNLQMYGIALTSGLFLLMLAAALVLNMGAPGIPGGGIVIGATYLSILGIPLDFIGFYAGIYRLLDMAYTTMNVSGDISANLLIRKIYEKT